MNLHSNWPSRQEQRLHKMSQQGLRNENNTDNGFLPEIDDCVSVLNKSSFIKKKNAPDFRLAFRRTVEWKLVAWTLVIILSRFTIRYFLITSKI